MPDALSVLVVSPPNDTNDIIFASVLRAGVAPLQCSDYREARRLLREHDFSLILCSDSLPDGTYRDMIAAARPIPVVVLSRFAEWEPFLAALHAGAFDYIACPPDRGEADRIIASALKLHPQPVTRAASAAA